MKRLVHTAVILTLVFAAGCGRTEDEKRHLKNMQEQGPVREAFNVRFLFSEQAEIQAELEAPHALEIKENEEDVRVFDRGMHLIFYTPEGERKSEMTSTHAKFRKQFKEAEIWGDVVMINEKGDRMETEKLYWDKLQDRLYTPGFVKIFTETEIIYGDSMISNTDFTDYKIYNITGAVSMKDEEL